MSKDLSDILSNGESLTPVPFRPSPEAATQEERENDFGEALRGAIVSSDALQKLPIPNRVNYLGGWCCEGDFGIIFAPRGVGKTWIAMGMAHAIAAGKPFGPWAAGERGKVLYIDGEMPLQLTQMRDKGLSRGGDLIYAHHEQLFQAGGRSINLSRFEHRDAITALCQDEGVHVIVLDNLSCLCTGISENDAKEWEAISSWLLELRRLHIGVIMVHHAGRNGYARGTSKREDIAAWVISLTSEEDAEDTGAVFTSHFSKPPRVMAEGLGDFKWQFRTLEDGRVDVTAEGADMRERVLALIEDGYTSATEIADACEISKSRVSKIAQKLIQQGRVKKEGRDYLPT